MNSESNPTKNLPHSIEAEMGVLGSMLLSHDAISECLEKVDRRHLELGLFYDPRHKIVFEAIVELFDARHSIDIITLTQTLRDKGLLDAAGGPAYISNLINYVPTAATLSYYLDIVRDKYCLRRFIQVCTEAAARGFDERENIPGLLDKTQQSIFDLGSGLDPNAAPPLGKSTAQTMQVVKDWVVRRCTITGLPTGFRDLDRLTGGLQRGGVFVILGRQSMGKTALAMNIVEHVALDWQPETPQGTERNSETQSPEHAKARKGAPVAVFSLDMPAQQLAMRLLCSRARVNLRKLREGFLTQRERNDLTEAASLMHQAPLFVDHTPGLDVFNLRTRARRLKIQHDIQLFVIDYLQLLHSENKRAENRQQEIAYIFGGIKALAKELNVPIILISQLAVPDQREGGDPQFSSDWRESKAIEHDADVVGLLVRPEVHDCNLQAVKGEAVLYIDKQRNGPTGDVKLTFLHEITLFTDRAIADDDESTHNSEEKE